MKQTIDLPRGWKAWCLFLLMNTIAVICFSQENPDAAGGSSSTSTTTTTTTTWYASPWVWVVGAVVLLLIIMSMVRGRSSTRETTIIKE